MSDSIAHTAHDDAPLSAAKNPDVESLRDAGFDVEKGDRLVGRTVTINRPRDVLYAFWRDFRNLPRFMRNVRRVSETKESSHWVIEAPGGQTVEWDAVLIEDAPGRLIAWQSTPGASIRNSGRVEFKDSPDNRGTCVTVTLTYDPPGGTLGAMIAKLFQNEPKIQARRDLRRFKQLMETGEIATAQPPHAAPRA